MITVHSRLFDRDGVEVEARDTNAHTLGLATISAFNWGRGALTRTDDPDAYVTHSFEQSRQTTLGRPR
jgi:hypothetical protein